MSFAVFSVYTTCQRRRGVVAGMTYNIRVKVLSPEDSSAENVFQGSIRKMADEPHSFQHHAVAVLASGLLTIYVIAHVT